MAAARAVAAVYAVSSEASSSTGTYTATSLKASDAWVVGEQAGGFSYSYPLPAAPSTGGAAPSFALGYDSGSVDGLTSHENNQSSSVGLGWQMAVPFLEQRFTPCTDGGPAGQLCWAGGRITLSMNGHSSGLVSNGAAVVDGVNRYSYRMTEDDPGWRIEMVEAGSGNVNNDAGGVYWKVTSNDGTAYYFGRENSAWSGTATNSTLTQPMFAQKSGDLCWDKTDHECTAAWRWNLAYVVDAKGNLQTYHWEKARYAYQADGSSAKSYDGAGYLTSVEYGNNTNTNPLSTPAPQKITFGYGWRCDYPGCRGPVTDDASKANYPDVPFDQWCADGSSSCPSGPKSPVYFSLKKLETVTATVSTGSGYRPVEKATLDVAWPRWNGNLWSAVMWLRTITRTGYAPDGTSQSLPAVSFGNGDTGWLNNRRDATQIEGWYQQKPRVADIWTELGGHAHVTYAQPNPCDGTTLEGNEDWQTSDCFPSREPNGHQSWFRRYLVTKLEVSDKYGAPTQTTSYDYDTSGGAAWHSDNDPITPKDQQSWSDYRGYRGVTIHEGTPGAQVTTTERRFFRGMAGDTVRDSSGGYTTRWSTVQPATSTDPVDDYHEYSGKPLEERVLRSDGSEVSATRHEYDLKILAVGEAGLFGIYQRNADFTWEATTLEMTSAGGQTRKWKQTTHHSVDREYGLPVSTQDDGDPIRGTGATCAFTTYAQNLTKHIIDTEATQVTATGACPADGSAPATANLIDRTDTYYDTDFTTLGAEPAEGLATKVVKWASGTAASNGSSAVSASQYDAYGRVVAMISPDNFTAGATSFATAGPASVTTYAATNGVVTGQTVTGPSGQTTTQVVEPGRRLPTSTTDQNGATTTLTYDPLGRLTAVRLPGDSFDAKTFTYTVSDTAPSSAVTSQYPAAGAAPIRSWVFYDSLGRDYQQQRSGPNGKVITSGTRFDARGNTAVTVADFAADAAAGTAYTSDWYDPAFTAKLPSQQVTGYDDVDRAVSSSLIAVGATKWTSTTSYDGTSTTTTPAPNTAGGSGQPDIAPTTTLEDLDGHVLSKTQGDKTTTYQFDLSGDMVKSIAPSGATTTYVYDWLGRRTSTTDPNAGTTTSDYYPSGNLKHSKDAKGVDLFTDQDVLGRPTGVYTGTTTAGALLSLTSYDGAPLGTTTPVKGTTTSETSYIGSKPGSKDNPDLRGTPYTEKYGYDARYRVTRTDQIMPGAAGTGLGGTYTTTVEYDGLGRETSTTYPAAGGLPQEKATTTWSGEYPTGLSSPLGSYVTSTGYTDIGQVASRILGTTTTGSVKRQYTWDPAEGKLLTIAAATPSTATTANLQADTYTYSVTGEVTKTTDGLKNQQQCYSYDSLDRLTGALTSASSTATGNTCTPDQTAPAPYKDTYTYDGDANLTATTHNATTTNYGYATNTTLGVKGGPNAPTSATTGTTTTAYDYDANGQLTTRKAAATTTSYTWDEQEHLVAITSGGASARFAYGPDDDRWVRATGTETVAYLAGQELHLASGATTPTAVRYYKLADHMVGERKTTTSGPANGTLSWILSDRQDSASVSVNATTGAALYDRYLPYGGNRENPTSTSAWTLPTDRGWLGKIQDKDTGLDYLDARYYDPVLAHFISTDPANVQDDPQTANPYGYAAGNPITYTDPNGLWPSFVDHAVKTVSSSVSNTATWINDRKATIAKVAVVVGTAVAAGAFCGATAGIGCAIIAGAAAGAVGGAANYGIDVAAHKTSFSAGGLLKSTLGGAAEGAAGGALGYGAFKAAAAGLRIVAKPATKAVVGALKAAPRVIKSTPAAVKSAARSAGTKTAAAGGKLLSGCKNSFTGDTPVLMADGTLKAIATIAVADLVLATDPATGLSAVEPVTDLIQHDGPHTMVDVHLSNSTTIHATDHHPFYNATTHTWTDAVDLKTGDKVQTATGTTLTITSLTIHPQNLTAYNLTINDLHTYYVLAGTAPILVHNINCGPLINQLLPKYGSKTRGILDVGVDQLPFISGSQSGQTDMMTKLTGIRFKSGTHVEEQVAAFLRLHPNIKKAVLYIEHEGGPCSGCDPDLPKWLPKGVKLWVYSPGKTGMKLSTYTGLSD